MFDACSLFRSSPIDESHHDSESDLRRSSGDLRKAALVKHAKARIMSVLVNNGTEPVKSILMHTVLGTKPS